MANLKKMLKDVKPEECDYCGQHIVRMYVIFDRDRDDAGHFCSISCIKECLTDPEFKKIVTVKGPKGVKKYVI